MEIDLAFSQSEYGLFHIIDISLCLFKMFSLFIFTLKSPLQSKTFDFYVLKIFLHMCPFYVSLLFSLLFNFFVLSMCTIYSTIWGWKTTFDYYFYVWFLVKSFDVQVVTYFCYIFDSWQYFYSIHVLLSLLTYWK